MQAESSESNWPKSQMVLKDYEECYASALNRMAVVLNSCPGMLFRNSDVRRRDEDLATLLRKKKHERLVHLNKTSAVFEETDEFRAENHFYGRFEFKRSMLRNGSIPAIVIYHDATDTFIAWSFKRLFRPAECSAVLIASDFDSEIGFAKNCATNYLLKNFWHNYVHYKLQGVSSSNYKDFGGGARFDSDFEADNLGNLLLLLSYGVKLFTSGKGGDDSVAMMKAIFARNQCNLVFAERAKHRA